MFKDFNDQIKKEHFIDALFVLKKIWFKYPKNIRVFEEIKKLKKRKFIHRNTSLDQNKINNFFTMHEAGKTLSVINNLQLLYKNDSHDYYVLSLLGTFNGLIKNYKNAIQYQELSIKLNPFDSINYINLSLSLEKEGNVRSALSFLEIAKLLDDNNIPINLQLARLYYRLEKYESAHLIYKHLIELDKNNFDIILEYIKNLLNLNKAQEALMLLKKIDFNKQNEDKVLSLEGLANLRLNKFHEAEKNALNALEINNENYDAYLVLGTIKEKLGLLDMAIVYYTQATKLNKKSHVAFNNLATCYSFIGEVNLSISTFKEAIKINPLFYSAIYGLGQMQIYNGEFNQGWLNFQERWRSKDYLHQKLKTSKPLLKKLENKSFKLLAWNEQGLGDQVMYGSMFNELSQLTSKLTIKLDKRLINIFEKTHPKINFIDNKNDIKENEYDFHIPFGNIGIFLRSKKEDFLKTNFPYIYGNNETKSFILNKYKEKKCLLVGLSWSSSNILLSDHKSLSLETLHPILKINNIKFISLEYKDNSDEINLIKEKYGIKILKEDSIDNFNNIEGLCSIIDACDFIISCSNTNAHLSGALNKKTYLLLPKGKGRLWNWNINEEFSLWYPKTKIFQQSIINNWEYPINNLKDEIINNEIKIN